MKPLALHKCRCHLIGTWGPLADIIRHQYGGDEGRTVEFGGVRVSFGLIRWLFGLSVGPE